MNENFAGQTETVQPGQQQPAFDGTQQPPTFDGTQQPPMLDGQGGQFNPPQQAAQAQAE